MRPILAVLVVMAGPALAQMPYANGAGAGRNSGQDAPRPSTIVEPLPSPEDLAGPAIPDFVVDRFELDTTEARAYRAVYDSFMTTTKSLRDSATALRVRIDALWQSGDRYAARTQFPLLRHLGDQLAKEDDHFDDHLKKIFSKPHYKDYKDWRGDQRRQADQDRKDRMKQLTGASPGR
ncbi:MAG TPA: hypothetical protein VFD85_02665 [Gemmatimonadales bacterium]|nr:hypothetical protein [Gemmatimonadales bacterium]